MKNILAIGLTLTFVVITAVVLHAYRASAYQRLSVAGPPSSQIFIHGTPVCVFRLEEGIVARVGPCAEASGKESDSPVGKAPFSGDPAMDLPPGHPPVDRDMAPANQRRVLI